MSEQYLVRRKRFYSGGFYLSHVVYATREQALLAVKAFVQQDAEAECVNDPVI